MQDYPNYYNDILNNYPDYIPSLFDKTIENDLNRTFPDEEFFQDKENINKIRNILIAFSRRNSSIGYTQGFNFIVGRLLSIIKNEVSIIKYYVVYLYYITINRQLNRAAIFRLSLLICGFEFNSIRNKNFIFF